MTQLQTCDNCGRQIGVDEQAEFFKQHIVCPECKQQLARSSPSSSVHAARKAPPPAPPQVPTPAPAPARVNEDVIDWTVRESAPVERWSPSTSRREKGWPKWAKFTLAGTVACVVVIVGGLHLLDRANSDSTADAALPPATVKPATHDAPNNTVKNDLPAAPEPEAGKAPRPAVTRPTPVETPATAPATPVKPTLAVKPATPKPASIFNPDADGFDDNEKATPTVQTPKPLHVPNPDELPTGIDPDEPEPAESTETVTSEATAEPASDTVAKRGIEGQLAAGQQALLDGDYKKAMTAFRNALDVDRQSVLAMHGIGVTYYQMGEKIKAIEQLEKTLTTGTNRALVHNLAVVFIKENPMRAAKHVRDYLARRDTPLDEPLQNVLGAALAAAATTEARSGPVFAGFREFYLEYDRRLASARTDGMKRWGMQWIPGAEADAKLKQSGSPQAEIPQFPQYLQIIPIDALTPDKHPKQQ
jgi:hypothetical protein